MKKVSEVIKDLGGVENEDWKNFRNSLLERLNKLEETNAPQKEIDELNRQLYGGKCPKCRKEYKKEDVSFEQFKIFYYYFQPDCDCFKNIEKKIHDEELIKNRLIEAGIKKKYLDVKFDNWENVSQDLNDAFLRVKEHYLSGEFKKGIGLLLTGEVGTGKTRCAVSVMREAAKYTNSLLFLSMSELIPRIINDYDGKRLIDKIKTARMVILDDFDKISTANDWVKERIFEIIEARVAMEKASILTSNIGKLEDYEKKFGKAICSRIFGSCKFITFFGKDYRTKEIKDKQGV